MVLLSLVLLVAPPVEGHIGASADTVVLDGRLDDDAWASAPTHRLAFQKEPRGGDPPSVETTWQAVVVGNTLYVGVVARAGDVPMVARRTRRDRPVESDRITVDIDTRGRGQDAFHFEVTAGGSVVDGVRYNDTVLDLQWDAAWDARVTRDSDGWVAELEIPLRLLRRPPNATAPVHIQVRRYVSNLGETDEWGPTPRDKSREVSAYLPVRGLALPPRRVTVDVLPYLSLGTMVETPEVRSELIRRYGVDAKLQIGSDVSLDATVLPDFGTVEADTAVFNLNPVEVRFPEKRPFFLEGTDVFNTPFELFYSRRIGSLTGTTTGTAVEAPPPATVLGAGKLLARAGRNWSIGALAAGSDRVDVAVRDPELGVVAPQRVAPRYLYGALRVRRELPFGSHVGVVGTSRSAFGEGIRSPFVACPDGRDPVDGSCFTDAYALAPDVRVRSKNGHWAGIGQVAGTYRYGGPTRYHADGSELSSGELGAATKLLIEKTGGRVIGYTNYEWYGRNADWNATGFLPRPNHHFLRGHLGLQTLTPHGHVFEDRWQAEVFQRFALDGTPMGSGYQANYRAKWRSFWWSFVELHYRPRYYDNREARDGTPVERIGLVGLELTVKSDPRQVAGAEFEGTYQQRWNGLRFDGGLDADLRLFGPFQLRFGVQSTVDRGEPRWVDTDLDANEYQLARLYAHALGFIMRLNYTITPRLELQLYGQLLGVATNFEGGFRAPVGIDRVRLDQLTSDPDFAPIRETEALLVGNLFLRWEYAPGSNVYLVFTRNQLDPADPNGGGRLDYASVGRNPAVYTFLVKTTMLLGR
jgi:hypothetical protein